MDQRRCVVNTIDDMVHEHYPFAEYKGIDLDEFSAELRSTLEVEDNSDVEFLGDVNYALRLLKDGHTRMEQRFLQQPATAPLEVREDGDGRYFISVIDDEDFAELRGRQVVAVDGEEVEQALRRVGQWTETGEGGAVALSGLELALAGEAGTAVHLTLDGGEEVELDRRSMMEPPQAQILGDVGYIRLDTFGFIDDLERLDQAVNDVMNTRGLIIDIRSNGGGFPSVSDGLFGRLIDEEVAPFRLVHKNGEVAREMEARPRGQAYQGEVVVLVNGRSYSASNFFAHRMTYHERGVLIGERTGGGAASPKKGVQLLPGIWFQVSSHLVLPPNGEHKESGIDPAIEVGPEDYEGGENTAPPGALRVDGDPVINRALRYLEELE